MHSTYLAPEALSVFLSEELPLSLPFFPVILRKKKKKSSALMHWSPSAWRSSYGGKDERGGGLPSTDTRHVHGHGLSGAFRSEPRDLLLLIRKVNGAHAV